MASWVVVDTIGPALVAKLGHTVSLVILFTNCREKKSLNCMLLAGLAVAALVRADTVALLQPYINISSRGRYRALS